MATVADVGILGHFTSIFTVILVFVISYGVMEMVKPFKMEAKGLHALIALVIAFLVLIFEPVQLIIKTMTPWFFALFLFLFLVLMAVRMFNVDADATFEIIKNPTVHITLVVLAFVIVVGSVSSVVGQGLLEQRTGEPVQVGSENGVEVVQPADTETSTNDFSTNVLNTLFNPKVLGLILVMLVGLFMIMLLTVTPKG